MFVQNCMDHLSARLNALIIQYLLNKMERSKTVDDRGTVTTAESPGKKLVNEEEDSRRIENRTRELDGAVLSGKFFNPSRRSTF